MGLVTAAETALATEALAERPWAYAREEPGEEVVGPDGGAYVWVPAGEFAMGSLEGADNEKPLRQIRLTQGFWLGKHPVTYARYFAYCEETGLHRAGSLQHDDHPVSSVSWFEATAYCDHFGLRLPTEAEWEYAARGPEALRYPWGNHWNPERCPPVGSHAQSDEARMVHALPQNASWCDARHMVGNVWEWCQDWYAPDYRRDPNIDDPPGPATGKHRVVRGNSWYGVPLVCRCTGRHRFDPADWSGDLGFRCVIASPVLTLV